jgi:hypothetical protein
MQTCGATSTPRETGSKRQAFASLSSGYAAIVANQATRRLINLLLPAFARSVALPAYCFCMFRILPAPSALYNLGVLVPNEYTLAYTPRACNSQNMCHTASLTRQVRIVDLSNTPYMLH